jgi:hypothetical protein
MTHKMTTQNQPEPSKGFALLIKAPRAIRQFVPLQGETIKILDESGKEIWNLKLPIPIENPGVIFHEIQVDLLTEREFGNFCQKTWNRDSHSTPTTLAPPTNPS